MPCHETTPKTDTLALYPSDFAFSASSCIRGGGFEQIQGRKSQSDISEGVETQATGSEH